LTPHVMTGEQSEAAKKFVISSKERMKDLQGASNESKYTTSPAERMREIKANLGEVMKQLDKE
jgi:hypothetical protein